MVGAEPYRLPSTFSYPFNGLDLIVCSDEWQSGCGMEENGSYTAIRIQNYLVSNFFLMVEKY